MYNIELFTKARDRDLKRELQGVKRKRTEQISKTHLRGDLW